MILLASIWWFIKQAYWFVVDNWKSVLAVLIPLILIVVFGVILNRSCNKPPKLDQRQVIEAQKAIEKQDRQTMERILAESDTREAAIDSTILQVESDREKAKKNYVGWSNEQLAVELERRTRE